MPGAFDHFFASASLSYREHATPRGRASPGMYTFVISIPFVVCLSFLAEANGFTWQVSVSPEQSQRSHAALLSCRILLKFQLLR